MEPSQISVRCHFVRITRDQGFINVRFNNSPNSDILRSLDGKNKFNPAALRRIIRVAASPKQKTFKMKAFMAVFITLGILIAGCKSTRTTKTSGDTTQPGDSAQVVPKVSVGGSSVDTVTTASGLKYVEIKVGKGAMPQVGQKVTVHYTGWLTNGEIFVSSKDRGQPLSFTIGRAEVIQDWDEGVATMKIGGTRKLIIPSTLAYGERGTGGGKIPPNSALIFEMELLGVQ